MCFIFFIIKSTNQPKMQNNKFIKISQKQVMIDSFKVLFYKPVKNFLESNNAPRSFKRALTLFPFKIPFLGYKRTFENM
jgi:hypothetical protein